MKCAEYGGCCDWDQIEGEHTMAIRRKGAVARAGVHFASLAVASSPSLSELSSLVLCAHILAWPAHPSHPTLHFDLPHPALPTRPAHPSLPSSPSRPTLNTHPIQHILLTYTTLTHLPTILAPHHPFTLCSSLTRHTLHSVTIISHPNQPTPPTLFSTRPFHSRVQAHGGS